MLKLTELFSQSLNESVDGNKLVKAINEKKLISIYYESPHDAGKEGYPTGWRRIEPFCYGVNKHDNSCLRAWELHGVSYSYPENAKPDDPLTNIPGWRMFRVDGIKSINEVGNDRFTSPRPKYNPNDKDMKIIYASVNFGTDDTSTSGSTQPSSPSPVTSVDNTSSTFSTPAALPPPTEFGKTFSTDIEKNKSDDEIEDLENNNDSEDINNPESNPDKPQWFKKFGDFFDRVVNIGKNNKDKV